MTKEMSEVNPNLSEAEKERNYREELVHMTGQISKTVDAMHSVFGHEPTDTLPENVSGPVHARLVENIRKLQEVIEQLEENNPKLKNRAILN